MLRPLARQLTIRDSSIERAYSACMHSPRATVAAVRQVLIADQHLRWAYVFGSLGYGTQYRDVDVALMPGPGMPPCAVVWGDRIARLEAAVGCKVDLIDLSCADLPLVGPMLLERIVVVDREPSARHAFEAETTSRWLDFKPSYEEFLRVRSLAARVRMQGDPRMVGRGACRQRLKSLLDALADLRRYRAKYDAAKLSDDRDAQHMVLHALYVAAQCAIGLALHAAADAEQSTSATYQQAFQRLAAAGRLDTALAQRMMGWAGLRNVLAHHYASIDYARVAATLANELPDLEQFAAVASTWT